MDNRREHNEEEKGGVTHKYRDRPPQSNERRTEEGKVKVVKKRERPPHSEHQREGYRFEHLFLSRCCSPRPSREAEAVLAARSSFTSCLCACAYVCMRVTGALRTPGNCGCALVTVLNGEELENFMQSMVMQTSLCVCVSASDQSLGRGRTIVSTINTTRKHTFPR